MAEVILQQRIPPSGSDEATGTLLLPTISGNSNVEVTREDAISAIGTDEATSVVLIPRISATGGEGPDDPTIVVLEDRISATGAETATETQTTIVVPVPLEVTLSARAPEQGQTEAVDTQLTSRVPPNGNPIDLPQEAA